MLLRIGEGNWGEEILVSWRMTRLLLKRDQVSRSAGETGVLALFLSTYTIDRQAHEWEGNMSRSIHGKWERERERQGVQAV